jgi:hypothetical protein
LGSSNPDTSDEERGPKYEKFRKDQINKKYQFRFGMEFNSLNGFREAIKDWSVLNGYVIAFVKNESTGERVECRRVLVITCCALKWVIRELFL